MTANEYLRAFKRYYKKMQLVDKQYNVQQKHKMVWVTLIQDADSIIKFLEKTPINKAMLGRQALTMDKNLEGVLDHVFPNDALLVRIKDLVISLSLFCKRKKDNKK
jgi:hypothetical protein